MRSNNSDNRPSNCSPVLFVDSQASLASNDGAGAVPAPSEYASSAPSEHNAPSDPSLPRNPRTLASQEQGVWMELRVSKGSSLFGSSKFLGEFFVLIDRSSQQGGTGGLLPASSLHAHRAQPPAKGTLRWYDAEGLHKRQIDAIDVSGLSPTDVTAKFEEVHVAGVATGPHKGGNGWAGCMLEWAGELGVCGWGSG